jgi:hypothetical protein
MRKVSLWLAPVVAAAAIMALTLGGVAQASKHVSSSPVKGAAASVRPNNAATGKLLKNNVSVQNQSGFGSGLAPGFNNVDAPHSIACPATKAPCTIETVAMIQFDSGVGGFTPGPYAICLLVDGNYNTCPYLNSGANNGFFTTGTATGYLTVGAGTHSVQTQLYVSGNSALYNYDIAYHEYG